MENAAGQINLDLQEIAAHAQETFGNLSAEQLNWKPDAQAWSIGQCFDHLIKSNELYFDNSDRIANGTHQNSFYENYSPLSGFFGKFIANALEKDVQKTRTISSAVPPGEIELRTIKRFITHQTELMEKIKLMENADWQKTKLSSPFLKIATYNLVDCLQIIIEHERRHFRQAERVRAEPEFPKA